MEKVALRWVPREAPLDPAGMVAFGPAAVCLVRALAEPARIGVSDLTAAAGPRGLLLMGPSTMLPWVDDVTYLGWDDGVLCPTTICPDPPAYAVRRAVQLRHPSTVAHITVLLPGIVLHCLPPRRAVDVARLVQIEGTR